MANINDLAAPNSANYIFSPRQKLLASIMLASNFFVKDAKKRKNTSQYLQL